MFGDNKILGNFNMSVDNKHRVCLPKATGVEKGEPVAVVFNGSYYEIKSARNVAESIERIKQEIESTHDIEKLKALREILYIECSQVIKTSLADGQGRIVLPEELSDSRISAVGGIDSLIIKKTL